MSNEPPCWPCPECRVSPVSHPDELCLTCYADSIGQQAQAQPQPASAQILPLRPDQPSAAGRPHSPEVLEAYQDLLSEILSGKVIGLAFVAFDGQGHSRKLTVGKVTYAEIVAGLEKLKFETLLNWRKANGE